MSNLLLLFTVEQVEEGRRVYDVYLTVEPADSRIGLEHVTSDEVAFERLLIEEQPVAQLHKVESEIGTDAIFGRRTVEYQSSDVLTEAAAKVKILLLARSHP